MDDFYTVTDEVEITDTGSGIPGKPGKKYSFTVQLNPDHPVYGGHFPGNPVVPGVCQVEMIRELSSHLLKKEILLSQSDNIKFLSMIRPAETPVLTVSIDLKDKEPDSWSVTAVISREEQVFLKFKGVMIPESKQI